MNKEIIAKLYEEVPVDIKPGRGNYKYVKTKHILDRLNTAFEGKWSTKIIYCERIGDEVLVQLEVIVTTNDGVFKQAGFGSAKVFNKVDIGNIYKSAKSKAIKDAVRNWGLGLNIVENSSDNYSGNVTMTADMVPAGTTNTPPMGNINTPPSQAANNTLKMPAETVLSMPDMNVNLDSGAATPFSNPTLEASTIENKTGNLPPMGTSPSNNMSAEQFSLPTQSIGIDQNENALTKVTAVQKVAIEGKLRTLNVDFKTYATEVLKKYNKDISDLPDTIDELSYSDAMLLASQTN